VRLRLTVEGSLNGDFGEHLAKIALVFFGFHVSCGFTRNGFEVFLFMLFTFTFAFLGG
jgi:hypothetical protein